MLKYNDIDSSLKALAEPTRRKIVERLSAGPLPVSTLAAPFDITLAAVTQHLQVLEACGLVASEKVGRVRTCRLDPAGFEHLSSWIAERKTLMERRFDRLGEILAEPADDNPAAQVAPADVPTAKED